MIWLLVLIKSIKIICLRVLTPTPIFQYFAYLLRTTTCKCCLFIKVLRLLTHKNLKHMVLVLTLLVTYILIHLLVLTHTCKIRIAPNIVLVLTPIFKFHTVLILTSTCKIRITSNILLVLTLIFFCIPTYAKIYAIFTTSTCIFTSTCNYTCTFTSTYKYISTCKYLQVLENISKYL